MGDPFQMRGPAPGATAAARGIDEHAVKRPFRWLTGGDDISQAGPFRPETQFAQGRGTDIVGGHFALGSEDAGKLE